MVAFPDEALRQQLGSLDLPDLAYEALRTDAFLKSCTMDTIDAAMVLVRLHEQMRQNGTLDTATQQAIRSLLGTFQNGDDASMRVTALQQGATHFAIFTNAEMTRVIGLLELSSPYPMPKQRK
jgi:hypothetical protein